MTKTYGRKSHRDITWLHGFLAAVSVMVLLSASACSPPATPQEKRARLGEKFDGEVGSDQRFGGLMPTFRAGFPAEYEKLKAREIAAIQADASQKQQEDLAYDFMTDFLLRHTGDAALAPPASLKAFRERQLSLTTTLQRSSEQQCADYFIRGIGKGAKLDAASQDAMGRLTGAIMDAIVAGQQDMTVRSGLTNADRVAMVKGLERNGFSRDQLKTFGDAKTMATLPAHEQCALGIGFERGINGLPESLADKITVAIIKDSAKEAKHKT